MRIPPDTWWRWGQEMLGRDPTSTSKTAWRRWRSAYGVASPDVMADFWDRCNESVTIRRTKPRHMLWAIIWLKTYGTESDMCDKVRHPKRPDEKEFREAAKAWVEAIANESYELVSECDVSVTHLFCALFFLTTPLYAFPPFLIDHLGTQAPWRHRQPMSSVAGLLRQSDPRANTVLVRMVFQEMWWGGCSLRGLRLPHHRAYCLVLWPVGGR